jgi:hypothetical protein
VHAHFRLLKRLLANVDSVRIFIDQDETLRTAAVSASADEVRAGWHGRALSGWPTLAGMAA